MIINELKSISSIIIHVKPYIGILWNSLYKVLNTYKTSITPLTFNPKQMNTNEQLINHFYQSFKNRDYKGMQECYHDDAVFNDEAFTNLNSKQVKAMWEMFCSNPANEMQVNYKNIQAQGDKVTAEWDAKYLFTLTGRRVHNHIQAEFEFKDGKILRHTDRFDFPKWAKQVFGLKGLLIAYFPPFTNAFKGKVQKTLDRFMAK